MPNKKHLARGVYYNTADEPNHVYLLKILLDNDAANTIHCSLIQQKPFPGGATGLNDAFLFKIVVHHPDNIIKTIYSRDSYGGDLFLPPVEIDHSNTGDNGMQLTVRFNGECSGGAVGSADVIVQL